MTTAPRCRNGSDACLPHLMSDVTDTFQVGIVVRLNMGLTIFRYTMGTDPLDPANYVTADLSANATVVAALLLTDPGNGVDGITVEDGHFMLGIGIDDLGRVWLAGNIHNDPQAVCFSDAAAGVPDFTTWNTLTESAMPWAASGLNLYTYNHFDRMSDGRLVWVFSQEDQSDARGRDQLGYYLPLGRTVANIQAGGTAGWRPICDTASGTGTWTGVAGSLRGEIGFSTGTVDTINDPPLPGDDAVRCYVNGIYIERKPAGDRLWVLGHWRTDRRADGAQHPYVVYTDEIGLNTLGSWRNPAGEVVTMPMSWDNRAETEMAGLPCSRTTGPDTVAVGLDGFPHVVMANGITSEIDGLPKGVNPNYGGRIRADWTGGAWTWVNIGSGGATHVVAAGPDRAIYAVQTAATAIYLVPYGGNVSVSPNGGLPVSPRWQKGGDIIQNETITVGSSTAIAADTMKGWFDPVALSTHGRLDLLIPDGDDPRVYSFGANFQAHAENP